MTSRATLFPAILFTVITALCSVSCSDGYDGNYHKCEGAIWGTTYHITYNSDKALDDSILTVMHQVEMSLSPFADKSTVTRINRGQSVKTDSSFRRIFTASQHINRISGGAFDPTVAPLVNLWGFGYRTYGKEPTQQQIDSALQHVGITRCAIVADTIVKRSRHTEFDFSAITKGYGCDLVGEMLRRNDCTDYMVEIGGEVALSGVNPRGEPWRIMIDAPIENDSTTEHKGIAIIELTDIGVATSGNYRNFRHTDNGKVWHTISPTTGRPVKSTSLSATVIAPTTMMADALATACMAMPLPEAIAMIESLDGTSAMLITADSTGFVTHSTSRFPKIQK